jgi:hypothetical protein
MQNLYPNHQVDVELSYGDNIVLKDSASDDADGGGATSAEQIAPNLIEFNVLGPAHPSVIDRVIAIALLVGGHKRKRPPVALKHKQSKPRAD